ncbi:DNA polymerase Y family protein [Pelomonas sp. CA6]|uniref:DNA polymerase Y family protein n=1 Tax=Pelomonas sp. CA6 TaxID=2907999 RepID=UPI001F4A8540|nr:DNA polymerase Y family protein [Pelomonas sp. CA6]MCH7341902.1 DNA polymerase Y family protein [Pelomonas sp. CA6]
MKPSACWLALLAEPPAHEDPGLAWWALQFTPRVARLEEAVLLELSGSLRLFGGLRRLNRRIRDEGRALGLRQLAWAPNPRAALALARHGVTNGLQQPLAPLLDALPLAALDAARPHLPMLARLGCRRLGQLRALPRSALGRRFDEALLLALDQAYGLRTEALAWVELPERFEARLELPFRVEQAQALQGHAQALLQQLCAWLTARHAGLRRLTLHWLHDAMRARDVGPGGALELATAEPTRDLRHLSRLLGEHLARLSLPAPVAELSLRALDILPLPAPGASLLAEDRLQPREALHQLLERFALRLGETRVLVGHAREDHRPERMTDWQPWDSQRPERVLRPGPAALRARPAATPQPAWRLDPPLRLALRGEQPLYQGPLQRLAGPQRLETGWWDQHPAPQRDYYLFRNAQGALLWIYRERLQAGERPAWFLQGVFG